MTELRTVMLRTLAALLFLVLPVLPTVSAVSRPNLQEMMATPPEAPAEPEFTPMLGKSVPPESLKKLSKVLRAASLPGTPSGTGADLPIFAVLQNTGTADAPKYEVSNIPIEIVTKEYTRLRLERAHVALTPAADGRSCRFEVSGVPFGEASSMKISGNVEWAAGPLGGDKVDIVFALDDAPVDQLRAAFPRRFDPSVGGLLDVHGHGSGVVGEVTTEEVPATPLKGEYEVTSDWTVLGRTAPVAITGGFSLDDKSVRIRSGKLSWQGLEAELSGWFDPAPFGMFDLSAKLTNIDTQKVAADWNVPVEWRPASKLSGTITFRGRAGEGMLRYEASAPLLEVPGMGGYNVRIDEPKFRGNMLALNAEIAAGLQSKHVRVGEFDLENLPGGIQWYRGVLSVNTQNTKLWDGDGDGTINYRPVDHPAWTMSGRLIQATAPKVVAALTPWLGLDVEGSASFAYHLGQTAERTPIYSVHASLVSGRIGNVDVFGRVMEALAAADKDLAVPDAATLLPHPRTGTGTRVDKLFFEIARNAGGFDIGGLFLRSVDFQLDADGRCGRDGEIRLDGTVTIPEPIAAKMLEQAPWLSALRFEGAGLFVPILIGGKTSAPTISLAPDYGRLIANAKSGQPVTAPGAKQVRHVGEEGMGISIPGDPSPPE